MNTQNILDQLIEIGVNYGPKLIGAIIVLIVGIWLIKLLDKGFQNILNKRKLEPSLKSFLGSLVSITLKTLLVISVLSMVGIEMTSFIAILGAAGLAIGLSLSGSLQNFAGGVMILIFKPFKVRDYIEAQGYAGVVKEIQIFNTILTTPDNKTIIIPNGGLATSSLINYSTEPRRRVDWTFGIGYGDDVNKAREVLNKIFSEDTRVLKDPKPFIAVAELADSSVNLAVRVWVEGKDYWGVFFDTNEKVYNEFTKAGINIPYPQMDVHISNNA